MSDVSDDNLDYREQVARIDRAQAEVRKFVAEQNKLAAEQLKLAAEQLKFLAEQNKLAAEADKLRRDRFLAPILAAGAMAGAIAALIPILLRSWGLR